MSDAIRIGEPSDDPGARTALEQVRGLLIEGERIFAFALQHRLYALINRRRIAAATSGRLLVLSRRLLGGYDPVAIRWQDLKSAQITVGMLTATVTVTYSANLSDTASGEQAFRTLAVGGLRIGPAEALYRECQTQEQAWREKRRVRGMEEMRAQSGATQIASGVFSPMGAASSGGVLEIGRPEAPESPAQRLSRAREMLTQGLITDSEYEAIKARIVGSL